jgi:hypothetical protein
MGSFLDVWDWAAGPDLLVSAPAKRQPTKASVGHRAMTRTNSQVRRMA